MDTEAKAKEYDKIMEKGDKTGAVVKAVSAALSRLEGRIGEGKIDPVVTLTIMITMTIEAEGIYNDIVKGIQ